jgi:vancomycin resistance protein YoaR
MNVAAKWHGRCFMESHPGVELKTEKPKRRFAMKITYTTAAQFLLLLAACLPSAAQADINPDHFLDEGSAQISAGTKEAQIKAVQRQLESYEQQLRTKAALVENAWQQAVSAAGDFAGPYIAEYLQQKEELEHLQAALTPQIEQARTVIAKLKTSAALSDAASGPKVKPSRPARAVVTASNSHETH